MSGTVGVERPAASRLGWALVLSLAVTAGFVLLFGTVGLVVASGGRSALQAIDLVGLITGALLLLLGIAMLLGRGNIYSGVVHRASARINVRHSSRVGSFFLFGIAYGLASLGCALPLFLIVVFGSATAGDFLDSLVQFVHYALGMGLVLMALTVAAALFKSAVAGYLRLLLPYVERVSALLVALAGLFIVYYWIGIGGLGPDALQVGFLNDAVEKVLGVTNPARDVVGNTVINDASGRPSWVPGYAFGLGMVATINPCGFALLPAYLSIYVAGDEVAV